MSSKSATGAARLAKNSKPLKALARLGFAVNGMMHGLIGYLALTIALSAASPKADQSGAFGGLAATPGGVFLLWTVVVGMFALGLWLLLGAFLLKGGDPKRKWSHRVIEAGKALAYFFLGGTAFTFAMGGATDSASTAGGASASLLGSPGGVFLLFAIGLLVLGIGAFFVYKGVTKKFTADLALPPGTAGKATVYLGVAGYVAKGVALAVVAILILVAALTLDPSKSTGLDGALKTLAGLPFGPVILVVVGIGLIAYGVYCFVRAWRARL